LRTSRRASRAGARPTLPLDRRARRRRDVGSAPSVAGGGPSAPTRLERWLDEQIRFEGAWEAKVVKAILRSLSLLFERTIGSVQDLNRYRKELAQRLAAAGPGALRAA
jgi:hypothetical protein